ncbi:hypothetical protein V8C40DRAFT_252184 [Trichoderma camerunense]
MKFGITNTNNVPTTRNFGITRGVYTVLLMYCKYLKPHYNSTERPFMLQMNGNFKVLVVVFVEQKTMRFA